jgi:hypothetical protein
MSSSNNSDSNSLKSELKELPDLSRHIFEVELQKDPVLGLGFNIIGGIDEPHIPGHTGIFISKIRPDGPAAKDGRLRPGDRIFSVDDIQLTLKTHSEAVDIFRKATGKVRLVVEQDAETLILSQSSSIFLTPVTDSPVQESLRLSILKSSSSRTAISPVPSDTALKPADFTMTATVAVPKDVAQAFQQNEQSKLESEVPQQPSTTENGTEVKRTHRQSFREPLVTPPSEAEQKPLPPDLPSDQKSPMGSPSGQNSIPSVVCPPSTPVVEEEEDRASTISVAPSTYSVMDDVPKTPKKPTSIFDPSNPSKVTDFIFISIGAITIGLGIVFAIKYFKRR